MRAKVGLTGGIGCGKSLIARVFETIGIPVFYSDIEAKRLYEDKSFLEKKKKAFGREVVKNQVLQRAVLADIVFNDKDKLRQLNSMTHPKVFEMFSLWSSKQTSPYVIMESAILFENNLQQNFDLTISISSPKDVIIKRVMQRDKCSEQQVVARMSNQMSQEQKDALADYVIKHDDKTMLIPQLLTIHNSILSHLKE